MSLPPTITPASLHERVVAEGESGRLDAYLRDHLADFSRSRLQQLITEGCVTINETIIRDGNKKVRSGDRLVLTLPALKPATMQAQPMALDIVYEDEHLLVINKAAGLTVHPGPGNPDLTLVNALL
ncbi:MAG: hypothetical protein K2Q12_02985, partial [Rickettsiales bacterium]|nr:hypothetical protein [Rickettsiales bacterium]